MSKIEIAPLIADCEFEMVSPDCTPGAAWWAAKVNLPNDISEVLPYLNTELEGADYHHNGKVLIWDGAGKRYAFRPHEIAIAPAESREDARKLSADIVTIVNEIWNRRDEIQPNYEAKKKPTVLEVYKLLPKTNCRECDCPTCMAYAASLIQGLANLEQCLPLSEETYSGNRGELSRLL